MRLFGLSLLFISVLTGAFAGQICPAPVSLSKDNVRLVASAQIYRYAREMYRAGHYAQAAKAFEQMLDINCENKIAQYHLQKIAKEWPGQTNADEFLQSLPCQHFNFEEEDFLPAADYYETDPALLQEQLVLYNKRVRSARISLTETSRKYSQTIKTLETNVAALKKDLDASQSKNKTEIDQLALQLKKAQDNATTMQTRINELKYLLTMEPPRLPEPEPSQSPIDVPTENLTSLQEKLTNIQTRLEKIQTSIQDRNQQIADLRQTLVNNRNP